jgi:hypothetical protein
MDRRRGATVVMAAFGILAVVLGLLYVCLVLGPALLVGNPSGLSVIDRLKAENDVRTSLVQGFVGFLALAGAALATVVTVGQTRANREGRATDLFLKAIDLLAGDEVSVRHGGVYALEQLGEIRIDDRYRGHAHALLTAFVRQQAPWPPDGAAAPTPAREMQGGLRDDIGAALAVLGRRSVLTDGASSELERVDLRNAELHGLAIPNVCFAHSNLEGAQLLGAALGGATLSGAILRNADLTGADLRGADLKGADLTGADLSGARLQGAELHGVIADNTTVWPEGFTPPGA